MQPKTKFQHIVVELNTMLHDINPKVIRWAYDHCITHTGYRHEKSGVTHCLDCNHTFHTDGEGAIRCPQCGKRIKVFNSNRRTLIQNTYFSVLSTIQGVQLQRCFRLNTQLWRDKTPKVECIEVCRLWMNAKGETAVTSLSRNLGYYLDSFNWSSEIELRSINEVHLHLANFDIAPGYKVIPELRQRGVVGKLPSCNIFSLMKMLLRDNRIETILKSGDSKALGYFTSNYQNLDKCWDSYKIAKRHHYEISEMGMWADLIAMLKKLGRDIRCPKYICPDNLKLAHDSVAAAIRRKVNKEMEESRIRRIKEAETQFYRGKSKYFDIRISNEDIHIHVLNSIEEYKEEGDAMHHCVFANEYYARPESIILSARDSDGNRLETIEFNLQSMEVVQSRGVCNIITQYHDKIVAMVNEKSGMFLSRYEQKETALQIAN